MRVQRNDQYENGISQQNSYIALNRLGNVVLPAIIDMQKQILWLVSLGDAVITDREIKKK
jgi:hypothetical protein